MLNRRALLFGTTATIITFPQNFAYAMLPAILAAIAAVTALAVATGKAADALGAAVVAGQRLYSNVSKAIDERNAKNAISKQKQEIAQAMEIRKEVVRSGMESQMANAAVVTRSYYFLQKRDSSNWSDVIEAVKKAASSLKNTAGLFRDKAAWFPGSAQDSLAELPRLYEQRVSILSQVETLSVNNPPRTNEELSAFEKLVAAYDNLRVQSLKLLKAVEAYTS